MIGRCFIYLGLMCLVSACSGPGYYLQAVSGQWKLLHAREDVQSILNDPATSPELAKQLKSARQIKVFAHSSLDLPSNGSYSSYVKVDGDALVWNVVATEEFSLQPQQWCFLVAGCVPYRGFFKQRKASESAERLRKKGKDVFVSPAVAYSSLGWFNDPLLSTMFSNSDVRLAAYLFHELAHQRLYLKGDGVFNEGYASFVEETGVKAWLEFHHRLDELLQWQQLQKAQRDFTDLIAEVRLELAGLYDSSQTDIHKREQKAEIFHSFFTSYEQLSAQKWQGNRYYDNWFEDPPNNAKLALYNTYQSSRCAFRQLLEKADGELREFHRLAQQKSRLPKEERKQWLEQTCIGISPPNNM